MPNLTEKKSKKRKPSIAVPTKNPFTGRPFASEKEKQDFITSQEEKRAQMMIDREAKGAERLIAVNKIFAFFATNGITEEDLRQVFRGGIFPRR